MEFLWDELTSIEDQYVSPQWHKKALQETEQRLVEGKEEVMDWNEAKQKLRNEFKPDTGLYFIVPQETLPLNHFPLYQ